MSENYLNEDNEGWSWYNWNDSKQEYSEDVSDEFGVTYTWKNGRVIDSIKTHRNTLVEMVERPKWGLACYMDNSIQSCKVDERFYHEALVHPVMSTVEVPKRVCIIGGGEGATAREVLKFPGVECVDMYEWDKDVVTLFRDKYPQWAQGAWQDSRLHLHFEDIFKAIKTTPSLQYDVIIIDLFEPCKENRELWTILLHNLQHWISHLGSIVMYSGMRNILEKIQSYEYLKEIMTASEMWRGIEIPIDGFDKEIIPYRVWIPSFSGESMFLLLKSPSATISFDRMPKTHLTEPIWNSYKTLNW